MNDVPTGRSPQGPAPDRYDIRVSGHLHPRWANSFEGLAVTPRDDGTTVIHGPFADQSALPVLLRRLGDLGLTLVCVTPIRATTAFIPADRPVAGPTPARSPT